jgi:hypothetical protein
MSSGGPSASEGAKAAPRAPSPSHGKHKALNAANRTRQEPLLLLLLLLLLLASSKAR